MAPNGYLMQYNHHLDTQQPPQNMNLPAHGGCSHYIHDLCSAQLVNVNHFFPTRASVYWREKTLILGLYKMSYC